MGWKSLAQRFFLVLAEGKHSTHFLCGGGQRAGGRVIVPVEASPGRPPVPRSGAAWTTSSPVCVQLSSVVLLGFIWKLPEKPAFRRFKLITIQAQLAC